MKAQWKTEQSVKLKKKYIRLPLLSQRWGFPGNIFLKVISNHIYFPYGLLLVFAWLLSQNAAICNITNTWALALGIGYIHTNLVHTKRISQNFYLKCTGLLMQLKAKAFFFFFFAGNITQLLLKCTLALQSLLHRVSPCLANLPLFKLIPFFSSQNLCSFPRAV